MIESCRMIKDVGMVLRRRIVEKEEGRMVKLHRRDHIPTNHVPNPNHVLDQELELDDDDSRSELMSQDFPIIKFT